MVLYASTLVKNNISSNYSLRLTFLQYNSYSSILRIKTIEQNIALKQLGTPRSMAVPLL